MYIYIYIVLVYKSRLRLPSITATCSTYITFSTFNVEADNYIRK